MKDPTRAQALRADGEAAREAGDLAGAEALLRQALRADPGDTGAANALGTVLLAQGRHDPARLVRAEAVLRAGLRHAPDAAALHHNLGLVLRAARRFAPAAEAFRAALARQPDMVEALESLGNTLGDLGDLAGAEAALAGALRLQPQRVSAHYNLALTQLAAGRYAEGFPRYEARLPVLGIRDFPQPRWTGEALDGRTLLVHAEQGFGDTIQFARFLPRIAGAVVLVAPRALVRLLAPLVPRVVGHDAPLPAFDLHCPLMSLPAMLGVTLDDLGPVPYLAADPARFRTRLAPCPRPWVGLAYAGATRFAAFAAKAVPPGKMARLLTLPGTFVSLQKDTPTGTLRPPRGAVWLDWTAELADFADTAELVAALDRVIAVDTAAVHLAGALGVPVWLLDRADPCWRWLRDRTDSPWYPGLKIFRQEVAGDWDGVLARVSAAAAAADRAGATAPAAGPPAPRPGHPSEGPRPAG